MDELEQLIEAGIRLHNALDEEDREVFYKTETENWRLKLAEFRAKYPHGFYISEAIPEDVYVSLEQGE